MPLPTTPSECPVCGADVPRGAKACPDCGADERTGWDDAKTRYDGLDLPDSAFEEESSSARRQPSAPSNLSWLWWLIGLALIAALVFRLLP